MRTGTLNARRLRATAEVPEAATRHLYWWLLLVLLFEYARPAAFVPALDAIKLQSLVPLSLFVMTIFAKGLRPLKDVFKDPLAKWILIYFAIIAVSLVTADLTLRAFTVTKKVFGYVLLSYMVVRIATTAGRIRGIYAALIVAHLFLLLMNPQAVLNPAQRNYIIGGSFLGDGNDFALSLCILLPMAIELALAATTHWRRLLCWGVLLVLVMAIVATSSRGGSLALAAVGGYLWLRSPRKILTLSVIFAIGLLLLAYTPDTYFERMSTIRSYQEDGSAMGRIIAWKASIAMFLDRPLFGVGAGNFAFHFVIYKPADYGLMPWLTAHSMYFLVLGELALPGIVALLVLVFGNLRLNSRIQGQLEHRAQRARAVASRSVPEFARMLYLQNASMIGFAVAGAFLSVAYYPHIFLLTALMVATRRMGLLAPGPADGASLAQESPRLGRLDRVSGRARISRLPRQSSLRPAREAHEVDSRNRSEAAE